MTGIPYPDGETVTTAYNSLMQPESLSGSSAYISDTNYDAAGRVTSRALGNGLTQSYAYYLGNQQAGRLKTITAGSLQNLSYSYRCNGKSSSKVGEKRLANVWANSG